MSANTNMTTRDRLIALDIETVPDRSLIPDWDEGKFAPKPIWHRVVAISFVEARIERDDRLSERYIVTCCRSGGQPDWDERRLLAKFWEYFSGALPRVTTWNGKAFDLPVLRARAMMYGIGAHSWYQTGIKWESYSQRFAPDWHCDLQEQLQGARGSAPAHQGGRERDPEPHDRQRSDPCFRDQLRLARVGTARAARDGHRGRCSDRCKPTGASRSHHESPGAPRSRRGGERAFGACAAAVGARQRCSTGRPGAACAPSCGQVMKSQTMKATNTPHMEPLSHVHTRRPVLCF